MSGLPDFAGMSDEQAKRSMTLARENIARLLAFKALPQEEQAAARKRARSQRTFDPPAMRAPVRNFSTQRSLIP